MLPYENFVNKIYLKFKEIYPEVYIDGDFINIEKEPLNINISLTNIYKEYSLINDFEEIFESYKKIIYDNFHQYKFKINYNNVYPIIKPNSYNINSNSVLYNKNLFLDLKLFFVSDMGETFRFIANTDDFDSNLLEKKAFENLNKMTNILSRLDKDFEIYALKFSSDYGATLYLSQSIQKQIQKKVGNNYILALPSSSVLIIAKYIPFYIDIIKKLIIADKDPFKITNKLIHYKNGQYSYIE